MHKLLENIERELHAIGEKGLNTGNVDMAYKLIDMYKDLKMVSNAEHEPEETEMYAVHRRSDAKYDRNINELYDKYVWCKKEYSEKGASYKEKVMESLECLMSEIGDLIFDINRDCDFKEERDIVSRHAKALSETK